MGMVIVQMLELGRSQLLILQTQPLPQTPTKIRRGWFYLLDHVPMGYIW